MGLGASDFHGHCKSCEIFFLFFLSSLLPLPFKKNNKPLASLFHLLDKLLFINSFIYLFT